ncbi:MULTISPECIES: hypothetical protein [Pseudoalteromonas]|uniref:hypothetical protein n=1 Tax=Pseudoalteromonas TaxID=53246 RepID=UPI00040CE011|nr:MULTISPECIES: hypothetical protein [Pseudoalteromonas]MBA6409048.1 hypothetical protein [Pseudoalteromonas sp. 5Ae-yellow]|tara:strand:- start:1177 stop:1560 length:384 start_codon:yes stop_codon:yes gene_type:complete
MSDNFEFKDTLSYKSPDALDCLMVPEDQWDEIHNNLKNTHPFRDNLLWVLCGICGGGAISVWATYFAFPKEIGHIIKLTFLVLGILLPIVSLVLAIIALKTGSETTSENVSSQMDVLKKGFRKLTTG